jgi:hypothetical protein
MVRAEASVEDIDESLVACGRAMVTEVEIDGETILYDEASQELVVLNGPAAVIWQNLDGSCSLRELIRDLAAVFEVDPAIVRADVLDTVRELGRHRMLEGVSAPRFLPAGAVGCASCEERLDELDWCETITFRVGGVHIGVRSNAPEVDAALRIALADQLADDVEAPANFSLRIGEKQGRGRGGLHILYDASEQLFRSPAPGRVVSALFAQLASYEAGGDESLFHLRIPAVVIDGVAVLVNRNLAAAVLDVEPRMRASGLRLVESPVVAVDTATDEVVVSRPAIALASGAPTALTDLDRVLATGRSRRDLAPPAAEGRYPLAGWVTIDDDGPDHQAGLTRPGELVELMGLVEPVDTAARPTTLAQLDRVFPLSRRLAVHSDSAAELAPAIVDAARHVAR